MICRWKRRLASTRFANISRWSGSAGIIGRTTWGLLVWQDMPSCNSYTGNPIPPPVDPLDFIAELTAMVTNHWNSPCIIMWDIFNEGQGEAGSGNGVGQTNTAYLVQLVKTLDPSRLVNQASGGSYFGVGDVLDNHSYPDPGDPVSTTQAPVDGEFGGIAWHVTGHLWNPAQAGTSYLLASSLDNFASLYDGYINEAINFKSPANGGLNAAIYTQITDVENECNGLMTYDRLVKPDPDKIFSSNLKAITGQSDRDTGGAHFPNGSSDLAVDHQYAGRRTGMPPISMPPAGAPALGWLRHG